MGAVQGNLGELRSSRSRAQVAADAIAELSRESEPGRRLGSKEDLRVTLGVSAGTLNEALRLLASREIVTLRPGPGGGVFASEQTALVKLGNAVLAREIGSALVNEARVVRRALELPIALDAVENATAEQLERMRSSIGEMSAAIDSKDVLAFLHATWAFHGHVAEAAQNELLRHLYANLLDLIESRTTSAAATREGFDDEMRERLMIHEQLLNAIEARDPDAAREAVRNHGE